MRTTHPAEASDPEWQRARLLHLLGDIGRGLLRPGGSGLAPGQVGAAQEFKVGRAALGSGNPSPWAIPTAATASALKMAIDLL
jgi:hypothetical protein